jgi:hypothetical protein
MATVIVAEDPPGRFELPPLFDEPPPPPQLASTSADNVKKTMWKENEEEKRCRAEHITDLRVALRRSTSTLCG